MSDVTKNIENEKNPVVCSYIISRYENGDIKVENNEAIEGITLLNSEGLYKNIEEVAESIKSRRIENAAYLGVRRFYEELERSAQESAIDPTI